MSDYRTLFVAACRGAHLGLILRVCLILLATLAPAAAAQTVLIGVLSFRPIDQTLRQWTPLTEHLSRSIPGHEFRVVPMNYPDLDQAVKEGRLDFVFTNPEHFVLLRNQVSLAPILTVMPQINGHPVTSFGGVIVTRADRSDINRLDDLTGRSVASPSEQSLGGNLMQLWEMRRRGIPFPKVSYLGMPHDRSVQALMDHTVDAAFVRTGVLEAMAAEGKLKLSDIKIINQQPRGDYPQILSTSLYPEWPICSDSKTPETLVKAVSLAMLSLEPGDPIATAAGFYGFSPPGDYSQVEAVMLRLRVHPGRMDEFDLHDVIDKYATILLGALTLLLVLAAGAAAYLVVVNRASALVLKQRDAAQMDLNNSNAELEYFSHFNAAIIGASHEGILVYQSDGACILVNPAACRFSGGSADQLLVQNFRTLASWRESGMIEAAEISLATGVPQSIRDPITTTFGKTFHMDVTFSRFFLKHEAHLLVNIHDTTEQYNTELELKAARERAEAASRAKSAFLANMSHEIRTPITGVLGMVDLLKKTNTNEEQRTYLETLSTAAVSLLVILNDILDISKIEANKLTIDSIEFDWIEIAANVVNVWRGTATAKGLSIDLNKSDLVPAKLVGDPVRFRQILHNLVSNAIKFTESGSVSVSLSMNIEGIADAMVTIDIKDTGIGMNPDEVARLFQTFSQADMSNTRRFGGTGLGLAIVKRLVGLMGGEVAVESAVGQGSCFRVVLPFKIATAGAPNTAAEPPKASVSVPARHLRILLAEDNVINQRLVKAMLQKLGHAVVITKNGLEAVKAMKNEEFDAVLMDMQMPEMDGEEATRVIREMPPPRGQIPIIALTADVMVEHRESYLESGISDLVAKPIDWQVLTSVLAKYCVDKSEHCSDHLSPIDTKTVLDRVMGDSELLKELMREFAQANESAINGFDHLLIEGNLRQIAIQAHDLNGVSANLGARQLAQAAKTLQASAESGNLDQTKQACDDVRSLLPMVISEARRIADGRKPT